MTHKALNQPWTSEEEAVVRTIIKGNPESSMVQKLEKAAEAISRTANAIQHRWYTHISKIRVADENIIEPVTQLSKEETHDPLIKVKAVKAYTSINGQVFLVKEDAVNANINHILEEMENASNLYDYITSNKEYVKYIMDSK